MSNKKTVYFHIGTHKTGTTALQQFFVDNKKLLAGKGICYENYNKVSLNHRFLINRENWGKVSFDENKNYIISSEDFYHTVFKISSEIKSVLSCFNINFIIYIKRQDLMKQSVYNQIVKMDGYCSDIHSDNHYNYDYYSFLKRLEKEFPNASVTVRPYEKSQFLGGSIFSDFLRILNIEHTNDFVTSAKVVNPSLNRDSLELARFINKLELTSDFRKSINRLIVRASVETNQVSMFRNQDILSPNESIDFLKNFEDGNAKIATDFLDRKNGILFFDNFNFDKEWMPYSSLKEDTAYELLQGVHCIDSEVLFNLISNIELSRNRSTSFVEAANFLMPILLKVTNQNRKFFSYSERYSPEEFSSIEDKLKNQYDSADIFREVAVFFEKNKDIETACKLMQVAKFIRPHGPLINKKLDGYQTLLSDFNLDKGE